MTRDKLEINLDGIRKSGNEIRVRQLAYFSAAIAAGEPETIKDILGYFKKNQFDHRAVYETILQSYLFLGFPRMIEAAIFHREVYGALPEIHQAEFMAVTAEESGQWFNDGVELCRRVYGKNYDKLKDKFSEISPEIFRWMVFEGYGKVLTRPGLNSIERELAEVAALIVDKRERQLVSHVIGSLNVGASLDLIKQVNNDIRPLAGEKAHALAEKVIGNI